MSRKRRIINQKDGFHDLRTQKGKCPHRAWPRWRAPLTHVVRVSGHVSLAMSLAGILVIIRITGYCVAADRTTNVNDYNPHEPPTAQVLVHHM